jgi:DNA-binding PadR family transcriptional regulator
MAPRDPHAMLPLTPAVFHILLTLSSGPLHGYRIMQEVERLTDGQMSLGQGTLYRSTERMLSDGLIEETDDSQDKESFDARRRTYRLTTFGVTVAQAESARLMRLMVAATERGLLPSMPKTKAPRGRRRTTN